jgi:hypothetical protein
MASVPNAKRSRAIKTSLKGIETLVERLKPSAAHYSGLLEPLLELIMGQADEQTTESVT